MLRDRESRVARLKRSPNAARTDLDTRVETVVTTRCHDLVSRPGVSDPSLQVVIPNLWLE